MTDIPTGTLYAEEARTQIFFCKLQVSDHERKTADARYVIDECIKNPFPSQEKFLRPYFEKAQRSVGLIKMLKLEMVYLQKLVDGGLPEAGRLIKVPEAGGAAKYTFPSAKLKGLVGAR